jgi:plastocyanin
MKVLFSFGIAAFLLASPECVKAANMTVTMGPSSDTFNPPSVTINQGDTVTWTNGSSTLAHTSTSGTDPGGTGTANGLWNSSNVAAHSTFSFTFNSSSFPAGNYPYYCIIHQTFLMTGSVTVASVTLPAPSVSITNPITGAKFAAPANITLMANATQSGGTITNVQFLSGSSPLGDVTGSPYNFTANSLVAGNYSFTAVAKNNQGGASTSAVVSVFVLTNAILSNPIFTSGQFQVTINGITGQTYATETSSNLIDWSAISTNVAPGNSFNVVDPSATNSATRYYRARQRF